MSRLRHEKKRPSRSGCRVIQNCPPRGCSTNETLLLSWHASPRSKACARTGAPWSAAPLDVVFEQPGGQRFIEAALLSTDVRVREDKGVSPAFLFATLLWHEVLVSWNAAKKNGNKPLPALFEAMDRVFTQQAERIAIPRRFEATIKEIWSLQPRFEQRAGQRPFRLLEHPRFRAAYDFLVLRAQAGEAPQALAAW